MAVPLQPHEIVSDAESTVKNISTPTQMCITPQKSWSAPFCSSSWTPECDASKEPKVGMIFNDIQSAQDFYIAYASHVGFSVRVGQQKKKDGVVLHKRFLCSK
ncbi:hypothetical protein DAI22_06g140500 [Oryza sativa Japonica Group]|nr:hypothetical protein DAI22_06g140500 [Oryza sativa Japonica Group]KAF2926607.1 hypothetical protein DAI22_06g140500 [Oryza sativa Japonica Group]KAF2926608.1 hypothetical protein DAI22_06g140500 [Oryza sativa Japonica Group]